MVQFPLGTLEVSWFQFPEFSAGLGVPGKTELAEEASASCLAAEVVSC